MDDGQRVRELYETILRTEGEEQRRAQAELQHINNKLLEGRLEWLKENVVPGHPLHTFVAEHEDIVSFLDELEQVDNRLQQEKGEIKPRDVERLRQLAKNLAAAEPHHAREEEALFPLLEKAGLTGPPTLMKDEHVGLREHKHKLHELVQQVDDLTPEEFKKRLHAIVEYIVPNLREHIFKEDYILYPAALQMITEQADWDAVVERCEQIGDCSFIRNRE